MFEEADYSMTESAFLSEMHGQNARYQGDDKLYVQFHVLPMQRTDDEAMKAGRPLFRDVEHIRIMQPGNKDSIIDRPITDEDKRRFARHYAAWQQNETELVEGTMLSAVARDPMLNISMSQIEELKHFGVRTVDQLANISDANAQKFMGISELRKRARIYLEKSEKESATTRLQAELEKRDNEIATLKNAVYEQSEQIKKMLEDPPKRPRGRPRKDAA